VTFDLKPEPVDVDRTPSGFQVKLIRTTDPRRSHLEGLTGVVECYAMGLWHVRWENGEHFAINTSDEWAMIPPSPFDAYSLDCPFECPVCGGP